MLKAAGLYIRGIKRTKFSFIINLIGLSSGLACAFLIYLWVRDEMNVDKFHQNDKQLYQVMISEEENGAVKTGEIGPGVLADALSVGMPEVEKSVAVINANKVNTLSTKEKAFKAKGIYAGRDFFEMFSFNLLEGRAESALADPGNIVITRELAVNLFGTAQNAIGQLVEFDKKEQFKVAGVTDEIPAKSSLQFDFVLLLPVFNRHTGYDISWDESNARTYILLDDKAETSRLDANIQHWAKMQFKFRPDEKLFARKFSSGYLYGSYENGVQSGGRIEYVEIFSITGIIILLIACINFISLSTVVATKRMKEVGMKKVLGAQRKSIIIQNLGESIFLAFISLGVALAVVLLLLPSFNQLADKSIQLSWSVDTFAAFFIITLLTGTLAGLYPAFYISAFNPVMIIKGTMANSLAGQRIRNGLVVGQFSISVILLMVTLVVYNQFSLIQNKNLGYNKDGIIYFDMDGKVASQREAFLAELGKQPGVLQASSMKTGTETGLFGAISSTSHIAWPGKALDEKVNMSNRFVDYGMIELLDLKMKDGRSFSREFGAKQDDEVIFNEAAVKAMGLKDPVGKTVEIWDNKPKIIGVVKDFYFESIQEGSVKPMFIMRDMGRINTIMVKVSGKELDKTITAIEEFHAGFNPGYPFTYKFLDDDFQKMYSTEKKVAVLSKYFSGLAIIISCLGLFGLTAFTVNKRKKELSTRKVLGADGIQLILLLYKDISKLVFISLLVGLPLGYIITSNWLAGFAERISIEPWMFIAAGGISFALMLIASGIQILKALSINPAESLRAE